MECEEPTILVVDDDEELVKIVEDRLSDYNIITANNGEEAVAMYKEHNPDIVVMDIVMPVMDGVTATEEIMRINPDANVIIITGHASSKKKDALKAGAQKILPKPLRLPNLVRQVEEYVQRLSDNLLASRVGRLEDQYIIIIRRIDKVDRNVQKIMEEPHKTSDMVAQSINKLIKINISLYNVALLSIVFLTKFWSESSFAVFFQDNKFLFIAVFIGLGLMAIVFVYPPLRNMIKGKNGKKKVVFALTQKEREAAKLRFSQKK